MTGELVTFEQFAEARCAGANWPGPHAEFAAARYQWVEDARDALRQFGAAVNLETALRQGAAPEVDVAVGLVDALRRRAVATAAQAGWLAALTLLDEHGRAEPVDDLQSCLADGATIRDAVLIDALEARSAGEP